MATCLVVNMFFGVQERFEKENILVAVRGESLI